MTQRCTPSTARHWFQSREAVNWGVSVGAFVLLYFVVWLAAGSLVALVVSMPVVFCLYFVVCANRTISILCPHQDCGRYINTNTPWICGFKKCRNDNVDEYPFIHRCQHCRVEPKAYKCHHCKKLVFFTDDQQKDGFAYAATDSIDEVLANKKREQEDKFTDKQEEIKLKKLTVEESELDAKLKSHNEAMNPPPIKVRTAAEELKSFLRQHTGDEAAAKELRAQVREEWKDDPSEMEKQLRLIDNWMRQRLK